LRAGNVRALYGVPLSAGDRLIGVAHMGSHSQDEFSAGEQRLFGSLALRAAAAIYEHMLRAVAEDHAQALSRSEARFRATFENAAVGIAVVALDGTFVHANPRYAEILGYAASELRGRSFQEFTHQDDLDAALRSKRRFVVGPEGGFLREKRYIRKDGSVAYVELAVSTVRDARGEPLHNIAVIHDVSARKHVEQELLHNRETLEQALRSAQQATRMRDDVLAIVSHDLRSPLSAAQLAVENLALRLGSDVDDVSRRQLLAIRRSITRMERLIRDLQDVAAIETGRLAVECTCHEAAVLVQDALDQHRELADERGIALTAEAPPPGEALSCDRERVMQVFGNLLGNALKFCGPGDRVALDCALLAGEARFSVADSGPGIAEAELRHVFEPYWTTGRKRGSGGTGLGLFISQAIVAAHGGRIWAESREGQGTTVSFTLKRA
jgi:PAS domain S-box-containing protein